MQKNYNKEEEPVSIIISIYSFRLLGMGFLPKKLSEDKSLEYPPQGQCLPLHALGLTNQALGTHDCWF